MIEQSRLADENGDSNTAWKWLSLAKPPTHSLSYLEGRRGVKFIKAMGFDNSRADKEYGSQ